MNASAAIEEFEELAALRARVAKLEEALHILRDRIWPEDEENFRVIDAALKEARRRASGGIARMSDEDADKGEIELIGYQLQQRKLYGAAQLVFQLARERDEARRQIELATATQQKLVSEIDRLSHFESLFIAGSKSWGPVYKVVLDERDLLRSDNAKLREAIRSANWVEPLEAARAALKDAPQ